jgi:hypothetical protein
MGQGRALFRVVDLLELAGLRRLAGSRGVKCLFFGDPTGKGRHYSGVGGGLGEAVIFGLDWSGRSNLSL